MGFARSRPASDHAGLFGELTLAGVGEGHPWGEAPAGNWWVVSGCENRHPKDERSFPAGFGLSDVRVTLLDEAGEVVKRLLYGGELDHLVIPAQEAVSEAEEPSEVLLDLACQLHRMCADADRWARRAENLAERTEEIVFRYE